MTKHFISTLILIFTIEAACIPQSGQTSRLRLTEGNMKNINSFVSPGEHSGITHIRDNRYAVVHDKLKGGGIIFFDLSFDSAGNVTSVKTEIPQGTLESGATRDPEGITYINGKLLVSGESDQKILEYDLEGRPTGRSLTIPLDMGKGFIQANKGFESLTSNEKTGLIWTTTECPLEKDIDARPAEGMGPLLRIQSFSAKNYKPAKRYLYVMDEPAENVTFFNYVHGVSEMLALDDGRLIIMEREVNADITKLYSKTHTKLFLVDPVNDSGKYLSKTLLYKIDTSSLDTANFEGMCLGPSGTLLLINDSQSRKQYIAGLVSLNDYILTLRFR